MADKAPEPEVFEGTPDQIRAAEKRAAAAARAEAAAGASREQLAARVEAPKGRRNAPSETA